MGEKAQLKYVLSSTNTIVYEAASLSYCTYKPMEKKESQKQEQKYMARYIISLIQVYLFYNIARHMSKSNVHTEACVNNGLLAEHSFW